jgi:hypothetical protein
MQTISVHPHSSLKQRSQRWLKRLIGIGLIAGIPVGAIWVANLPYPVIRRPVAKAAPMLLLPSYAQYDHNYRQAISLVEQAEQLVNAPTSAADIDLGAQKVEQAQAYLDNLPLYFLNDFPEYDYWWYRWQFSPYQFNQSRAQIGTLTAKVFQEQNAQTALQDAEEALQAGQQSYQQSQTAADRSSAIATWQAALDQFAQISNQTLAGRAAQQKLTAYERDFKDTVGLAAGNERTNAIITAAKEFASRAAVASQNPPHSVAEWRGIESLWQQAMSRLSTITADDPVAYGIAQEKLAEYSDYLRQTELRREQEANSVRSFQQAQQSITRLQNYSFQSHAERGRVISQLQEIINQLEQVDDGTTVYLEAQANLLHARNKLQEIKAQQ